MSGPLHGPDSSIRWTSYRGSQHNYQWTAFTEADLLANGLNGTDFGCGDRFVMPRCATVTMSTYDDDGALEGDNSWWYGNDQSEDRYGQDAYLNGSRIGCKMYAEQYHVLQGSNGCTYYLIEIKVEGHDSAGAGNGYFTFYGATPPAGVTLTVTQTCNVSGCWVNYSCLGAGNTAPPNTPPTFTNIPADGVFCVPENTRLVVDLNASDANNDTLTYSIVGGTDAGKFVIDANTGVLNFVAAPDYEAPGSSDGDNSYQVIVSVSDGKGGVTNRCLTVNVCDVNEGSTPPTCVIIEAESMQLCGFAVGSSSATSGGKFIYTLNNGVTYATTTYSGTAGTYDLTLRSFDQIGESYVSVYVNGVKVGSYGELADDRNWEEHVFKNVQLKPGDVIEIRGSDCGTNYIDYLKICPSGPTTGALEGRVFVDANKNGVDDSEAGVGGVTVQLLDSTGRVVGTTTTAADGSYKFDNLAPGNYTVAFPTSVNGKVLTTQDVGSNDAIDSDANVTTGLTGSNAVVAGQTTKDVDAGIADLTFSAVQALIGALGYEVIADPAAKIIGTREFRISVAPVCSGVEGIALVILFVSLYLWLFRAETRFPRALLLYPLGIMASALLNVLRIALLLILGIEGQPELAIGGFHSHAGWVMFTLVALGIVAIARHVPALQRQPAGTDARLAAVAPAPPLSRDPQAARILPFAVFMLTAVVVPAISTAPAMLYPLRVLILAAAVALFWPIYRRLDRRISPVALAAGLVVGAVWALIPVPPASTPPYGALAGGAVALWYLFRGLGTIVLVPLVEELFFRDYLESRIRGTATDSPAPLWRVVLAALVTAGVFAALHDRWAEAFAAGLVFSWLTRRSGRITDAIAAHAVANAVVFAAAVATGNLAII